MALIIATTLAAFQLPKIKFDPHIHAVIDQADVEGLIAVENQDSLNHKVIQLILPFSEEGLTVSAFKNIQKTTDSILKIPSVIEVFSIGNLINDLNDTNYVFLRADSLQKDLEQFKKYKNLYAKFIGKSERSTMLYIRVKSDIEIEVLKSIALTYQNGVLLGSGLVECDFEQALQKDVMQLFGISLLVIAGVFLVFYRSIWALMSTLIVVICTVIISLSVFPLLGFSLHPLTVMMPTITAIITLSDIIHLFTRYQAEEGRKELRISRAWLAIRKPIVLTSITTLIGFLSLLVADSKPMNELGLSVSFSIIVAFTLSIYALPVLMTFGPEMPHKIDRYSPQIKRNIIVICSSIVLFLGGAYYAFQIDFNSYLFDDQMNNSKLSSGLKIIEEEYSGIRGVEFEVSTATNYSNPKEIFALEELLKQGKELMDWKDEESIIVKYKNEYRRYKNGNQDAYQLTLESINYHTKELKEIRTTTVQAKIKDVGSLQVRALERDFSNLAKSLGLVVEFMGWDHLMDQSDLKITQRLFQGLLLALVLVSLILGFVFRDLNLLWLSLLVNLIPLVLLLALMHLLEIDLNLTTAAIFTISFGIAVDDTIHFIAEYQQSRNVTVTLKKTGKAIVRTSIVLAFGFGVLLFSEFSSVQKVGLLLSCSLIFAVLSDLILLPAILNVMESKKENK